MPIRGGDLNLRTEVRTKKLRLKTLTKPLTKKREVQNEWSHTRRERNNLNNKYQKCIFDSASRLIRFAIVGSDAGPTHSSYSLSVGKLDERTMSWYRTGSFVSGPVRGPVRDSNHVRDSVGDFVGESVGDSVKDRVRDDD